MWMIYLMCTMIAMAAAIPVDLTDSHDNEVPSYDFTIVSRDQWDARPPKETTRLKTPVPYVTIHHSYTPAACYSFEECAKAMRAMQNMHMDKNEWWDIGYSPIPYVTIHHSFTPAACYSFEECAKAMRAMQNMHMDKNECFAVGSDGYAYEGRGWEILGAHALHFNTVSIGICLIGDWTNSTPPAIQLKTAKAIIAAGVEQGYIRPDYRLVGHRQVRGTECPGQALFQEIKSWHHYSNFPASPRDLLDIPEIPESTKDQIRNATRSS